MAEKIPWEAGRYNLVAGASLRARPGFDLDQ
jgi:hypothetical protein